MLFLQSLIGQSLWYCPSQPMQALAENTTLILTWICGGVRLVLTGWDLGWNRFGSK